MAEHQRQRAGRDELPEQPVEPADDVVLPGHHQQLCLDAGRAMVLCGVLVVCRRISPCRWQQLTSSFRLRPLDRRRAPVLPGAHARSSTGRKGWRGRRKHRAQAPVPSALMN